MGDLAHDTTVEPVGDGAYRATLSRDWEIWGPMGGYVAAVALRAAGLGAGHRTPAAFSCHYLNVAAFGPVDIRVTARKENRVALSHRPHAWAQPPFVAPTLDLNVAFHQPTAGEEWLLCDGAAPLSTGGLFGWTARVWSAGGRLHASGAGSASTCAFRRQTAERGWSGRPAQGHDRAGPARVRR